MNDLVPYNDKVLATMDDVERAARAMAGSGFFADTRQASQAIVKILAARELGLGPFSGMVGVNIISGRPAFSANIMAACVKKSGRYNYRVSEMTDKNCTIDFLELIDGKWCASGSSSFSIEDARKAGTKNLDKFPRNMLFARAMSNGVRWYCPDVMNGSSVYTPEELGATTDQEGNVVTVEVVEGHAEAIPEPPAPAPKEEKRWKRPFSPEQLKQALEYKLQSVKPPSEGQVNLLRALWMEYFGNREDERRLVQEYLTGELHFSEIEPEMLTAMLDWLKPTVATDGTGAYVIDKQARKELNDVVTLVTENNGQQTLL